MADAPEALAAHCAARVPKDRVAEFCPRERRPQTVDFSVPRCGRISGRTATSTCSSNSSPGARGDSAARISRTTLVAGSAKDPWARRRPAGQCAKRIRKKMPAGRRRTQAAMRNAG